MKNEAIGLGSCNSISAFVENKLARLEQMAPDFSSLFEIMFSERENIMYERSTGYRIQNTTYGEVYDAVLRAVPPLQRALTGVPKQRVVGLYMGNSVEWIELFWAILAAGYCPLLMNTRLDAGTLEGALADSGAAAVISDGPDFSVPTLKPAQLLSDEPAGAPEGPFGEFILVMSSGTSSRLKLCAYTAAEFRHQIRDTLDILRQSRSIRTHYEGRLKHLAFLPFYHVFGLVAVYIWFGFFSRTFVHLADLSPQTILGTIRKHKVTHIFAAPLFWETVYNEAMRTIRGRGEATLARFEKGMAIARRLSGMPRLYAAFTKKAFREVREELFGESIQYLITGGSEIKPEVLEFFNAVGYHLSNGYGMSEIGITSVELSETPREVCKGFVGRPMSSVEYSLREDGELLVRGPSLAGFVLEGGEKRVNRGDWFPTGDLAACVDGRYRILGRKDDLVVASSGENLNPNLIEPNFDIPGVRQVCLISDADGAPVLLASVGRHLPAGRLAQLEQALRDRAAALGLTGQLRRIVPVEDDLIAEQEFKLCRGRLSRDYIAGRLTIAAAGAQTDRPEDPCYLRVTELFAAALGKTQEEIGPDTDFFLDGGGSSLDYFALVSRLREEFGVEFPTAEEDSVSTPLKLYRFIQGGD